MPKQQSKQMEKREIVFVVSILLLIASSEGQSGTFDYFQIVLSWQPAVCSDASLRVECWQTPGERFSIHGVWPSLYSSDWIVTCGGSAFDRNQIVTIRAGLNQNWPDVIRGGNEAFWKYEWEKHGTCFETLFNQLQFFTFGLNAYGLHDILSILNSYNIRPNGGTYTRNQVVNAIAAATGSQPALRCNTNYWSGRTQLHELSLCYIRNASFLIDCPSNANKCPNQFAWNSWGTSQSIEIESI